MRKYGENGCLLKRVKTNNTLQKDLLIKLLMMDPMKRLTVEQTMKHKLFDVSKVICVYGKKVNVLMTF